MNKEEFIERVPYLYHLTDRRNFPSIIKAGKLYSTVELAQMAGVQNADDYLHTRRPDHTVLSIEGSDIFIRDQRPLNRALDKCLTDNWTREDYIYHLNKRVFMWPNLGRLIIHFTRYESENPLILRFKTGAILEINNNTEITRLNSGATRPTRGKAPERGKDTFKPFEDYLLPIKSVAEVTFVSGCTLPSQFDIADSPSGIWIQAL